MNSTSLNDPHNNRQPRQLPPPPFQRELIIYRKNEVRNAQKKIADQNLKISVRVATEAAESAALDGKTFCIIQLDVGLDAAAVREAVSKVVEKKGMSIMMFSTDEIANKAVVCTGDQATRRH
ncbi:hypothetical protein F2Q68_00022267 [Brassica cretica]|uniref:Uncharacterized protein n=1 Tax=Brassica cretica TaxID=69181 RepID=A0A8S9G2B5_BRACR|nr:hypothetical protein F2Q68_00022267 [Brassica cretica]